MLRLLTTLICLMSYPLIAQININTSGTTSNINVSDPNGQLYSGIAGSPYFPEAAFYPGKISNGATMLERTVRFNMASGVPEYLEGNKVMTPSMSANNSFTINTPATEPLLFKNGFPAVDRQNLTAYYQVLAGGQQLSLLALRYVNIREGKEPMDNNFGKKWFEAGERYYLYQTATKSMQVINSPKSTLTALPDKAAQLKQYASEQKLKLKDWADAVRLIQYADGL